MGLNLMKNICSKMLNPYRVKSLPRNSPLSTGFTCGYSHLTTSWLPLINHYYLNIIELKIDMKIFQNLKWLLLFIILVSSSPVFSQNTYTFFESFQAFKPNAKGELSFNFDNATFFRNNEYTGKIVDGYTLPGAWIRPKLEYYPDDKLRVELGGNVLKYNGREEYYNLTPWFSVIYQPTQRLSLIMGNLNNDSNHDLIEPLLEPERFLTAKPEAGFQVKYNAPKFTTDIWFDWQQFIIQGDPFQERFVFGARTNLKIFDKNNSELAFPMTFYGQHQGGEITNSSLGLAHSYITMTPGLTFNRRVSDKTIKGWSLNAYYSLSTFPMDKSFYNKSNGWGFYANGNIDTRLGGLTLAYWHGHDYYTPQGGNIYQNLSQLGNGLIPNNELVNLKYHFDKEIFPSTHFGFMLDYYYDTINKTQSNAEGLYLVINFGIPLKKVRE